MLIEIYGNCDLNSFVGLARPCHRLFSDKARLDPASDRNKFTNTATTWRKSPTRLPDVGAC